MMQEVRKTIVAVKLQKCSGAKGRTEHELGVAVCGKSACPVATGGNNSDVLSHPNFDSDPRHHSTSPSLLKDARVAS